MIQAQERFTKAGHDWDLVLKLAAEEVFAMMVNLTLVPCEKPDTDERLTCTAMVGLAGHLQGVVSVRCTSACAVEIASKMLGLPAEAASDSTFDALGEICNMIAGNFKGKINGLSENCMLSVPTVIQGADYVLHSLAEGDCIEVWMDCSGSPILLSLQVHP